MATAGAVVFAAVLAPFMRREIPVATGKFKQKRCVSAPATNSPFFSTDLSLMSAAPVQENGSFGKKSVDSDSEAKSDRRLTLKDYFEQSEEMVRSDGGPPRWFSPLDCASRISNSPLLLFLPGIDGVGLGLTMHHKRLGEIFDIWCLHIPVMDRTPFTELVELVERTVRLESCCLPNRPIYLVGESIGACLALGIAARNRDIDLILILANPVTCFSKSLLQPLAPLIQIIPEQLNLTVPYILSLMTGIPLKMVMATAEKRLPLKQTIGELSQGAGALSSYISVGSSLGL